MKRILFIGMLFIIMSQIAFAQTFSVQGVLRDPLGKTVDDGYYSVTFRLYEQSTGGTAVWSETQGSVQVLHGVFNVELGTVTSLSDTPFDTTYWLGISIEGGTELEPRFKLLKTPAAMSVLGTDNVFPSKGNIGAGTLNPTAGLHIVTQSANTDLLKIESAGGGFIKVTSDGKMGVNVSDPNNPLAISGNLRLRDGGAIVFDDGTQIASANFGGSATGVASPGNALITSDAEGIGTGEIQFFIDTDPKMVIDHDGNVGIGTTTPGAKLDVNGNMLLTGGYRHFGLLGGNSHGYLYGNFPALGDGIHMGYNYYVNSNDEHVIPNLGGGTSRITMQYGNLDFATAGAGAGNPSSKMFINSDGNVGIGTDDPQAQLHVTGPHVSLSGIDGNYFHYDF
ncbi:MAG: hypothetical protein IIB44_05530, partial [Candidatus Marinimicrobia bacterium]|nr:hypothetical protein [Candidatus Neomarinimicrobiota bacterium]